MYIIGYQSSPHLSERSATHCLSIDCAYIIPNIDRLGNLRINCVYMAYNGFS